VDMLDVGEPLLIRTTWWDENGDAVNPSTIALTITKPDGTVVSKTKADMTSTVVGVWEYDTTGDQAGLWRIHAVAVAGGRTQILDDQVLVGIDDSTGPCDAWVTWDDVEACGTIKLPAGQTIDPAAAQLWLDQATEILYDLSGRRYPGICTATRSLCFACQSCWPTICSCDPYPSIDLGGKFPVLGAWDVTVDGVTLAPSAYTIRGRRWLVRLDGQVWTQTGWNFAQDPAGFRVSWAYGRVPPAAGKAAAAKLASEIAKRCVGDKTCQLPQRVTSINREGVTFTVIDPMRMLDEGKTGVYEIDLWLMSEKAGMKPRPHIYHPALGASRRY